MSKQDLIHSKGFDIMSAEKIVDYNKIKVGTKTLDDAVINLGYIENSRFGWVNKAIVYKALADNDIFKLILQ